MTHKWLNCDPEPQITGNYIPSEKHKSSIFRFDTRQDWLLVEVQVSRRKNLLLINRKSPKRPHMLGVRDSERPPRSAGGWMTLRAGLWVLDERKSWSLGGAGSHTQKKRRSNTNSPPLRKERALFGPLSDQRAPRPVHHPRQPRPCLTMSGSHKAHGINDGVVMKKCCVWKTEPIKINVSSKNLVFGEYY